MNTLEDNIEILLTYAQACHAVNMNALAYHLLVRATALQSMFSSMSEVEMQDYMASKVTEDFVDAMDAYSDLINGDVNAMTAHKCIISALFASI